MGSLPLPQEAFGVLPLGSWDCHHHIFDPQSFAYSPTRHLTVPPATTAEYVAFKRAHGIANSVLTHGLSYGSDNTSLLAFLKELNKKDDGKTGRTLSIAVIDPETTTDDELASLRAGRHCGADAGEPAVDLLWIKLSAPYRVTAAGDEEWANLMARNPEELYNVRQE